VLLKIGTSKHFDISVAQEETSLVSRSRHLFLLIYLITLPEAASLFHFMTLDIEHTADAPRVIYLLLPGAIISLAAPSRFRFDAIVLID